MKSHNASSIRKYFERYSAEIEIAYNFLEWLQNHHFNLGKPAIIWEESVYRVIYGNFDPLSVGGALARGGRFNIGGSQVSHFFPHLHMEACLYAASSLKCAKKEAGDPLGKASFFALKPVKPLYLWDLYDLVHNLFDYKDLKEQINTTPMNALWQYQKAPKISQILGTFLRKYGGDGLIYPSTKDNNGKTLAFFIKDDRHAHQTFIATEFKDEIPV